MADLMLALSHRNETVSFGSPCRPRLADYLKRAQGQPEMWES